MRQLVMVVLIALLVCGCALLDVARSEPDSTGAPTATIPSTAADVMAIVNGVRLTRGDLEQRMAVIQVVAWLTSGSRPADLDESLQVDKWIDSELMAQGAAQAGIAASDDDAGAALATMLAAAAVTREELDRQLALGGATHADLLRHEARELTVQRFMASEPFAAGSEIERSTRLATWLVRARASTKIEKPSQRASAAMAGTYAGAVAPEFRLRGMDGAEHALSELRGQVVLVNFWATWCGPCRNEMPAIQATYDAHSGEGFVVWGINDGEEGALVAPYLQQLKLTFPVMLDRDSRVSRLYRVYALPTTYFIGRDGVIKQVAIGEMSVGSLDATVKKLLQ